MKKWTTLFIYIIMTFFILSSCNYKSNSIQTSVSSLKKQMKIDKFVFYSEDKDKECIEDLAKSLENNYKVITDNLEVNMEGKINIYIYPDIKSLHVAMNNINANDGLVGTDWGDNIKIVSPLNPGSMHNYDSVKKVLIHEFTHVIESKINSNINTIPTWINEGIATYEAKQTNDKTIEFVKLSVRENKIPTIESMSKEFDGQGGDYIFSFTLVEFLINNFGYEKLVDIIKTPDELEKILGMSTKELEEQWVSYLKSNYKI